MGAVSEAVSGPLRKTVNIPGLISDYYTLSLIHISEPTRH